MLKTEIFEFSTIIIIRFFFFFFFFSGRERAPSGRAAATARRDCQEARSPTAKKPDLCESVAASPALALPSCWPRPSPASPRRKLRHPTPRSPLRRRLCRPPAAHPPSPPSRPTMGARLRARTAAPARASTHADTSHLPTSTLRKGCREVGGREHPAQRLPRGRRPRAPPLAHSTNLLGPCPHTPLPCTPPNPLGPCPSSMTTPSRGTRPKYPQYPTTPLGTCPPPSIPLLRTPSPAQNLPTHPTAKHTTHHARILSTYTAAKNHTPLPRAADFSGWSGGWSGGVDIKDWSALECLRAALNAGRRDVLARLRCASHFLRVKTGRWTPVARPARGGAAVPRRMQLERLASAAARAASSQERHWPAARAAAPRHRRAAAARRASTAPSRRARRASARYIAAAAPASPALSRAPSPRCSPAAPSAARCRSRASPRPRREQSRGRGSASRSQTCSRACRRASCSRGTSGEHAQARPGTRARRPAVGSAGRAGRAVRGRGQSQTWSQVGIRSAGRKTDDNPGPPAARAAGK